MQPIKKGNKFYRHDRRRYTHRGWLIEQTDKCKPRWEISNGIGMYKFACSLKEAERFITHCIANIGPGEYFYSIDTADHMLPYTKTHVYRYHIIKPTHLIPNSPAKTIKEWSVYIKPTTIEPYWAHGYTTLKEAKEMIDELLERQEQEP